MRKRFGPVEALAGLDLAVPTGSMVGFLGPNGAGKSTTIRILLDLARADSGEVRVLVVGYVLSFLVPLADGLAGARKLSPWWWALGEQPVSDGVSAGRLVLLVAVTAALVVAGLVAVERRDVRPA